MSIQSNINKIVGDVGNTILKTKALKEIKNTKEKKESKFRENMINTTANYLRNRFLAKTAKLIRSGELTQEEAEKLSNKLFQTSSIDLLKLKKSFAGNHSILKYIKGEDNDSTIA